jgi:hypothetical protein
VNIIVIFHIAALVLLVVVRVEAHGFSVTMDLNTLVLQHFRCLKPFNIFTDYPVSTRL